MKRRIPICSDCGRVLSRQERRRTKLTKLGEILCETCFRAYRDDYQAPGIIKFCLECECLTYGLQLRCPYCQAEYVGNFDHDPDW